MNDILWSHPGDQFPLNHLYSNSDINNLKTIGQGDGKLKEEQLKKVLRKYNLRNGLIAIGRASNVVLNNKSEHSLGQAAMRHPTTGVFITQFGLAYLANILLISKANDFSMEKEIGDKQNLLTLLNIHSNDLIAPELASDSDKPFTRKDLASTMVRMHGEQFEFQYNPVNLIARTIFIYTEIIKEILPTKIESFDKIFMQDTGLSINDYFVLVFAVWAASQGTATFRKESLTEASIPSMQDSLTDEKVTNFLKILSIDYKTFREMDTKMNSNLDPIYTKYRFNPLHVFPIIKTDRVHMDPFVVPNTLCLFKRGFAGLYWWFHYYFENIGKQLDFRVYFGEVFEQYVGKILKETYGYDKVHPEIIYPKGKYIDWWVEQSGVIYFFEAKSYQFALPTKQTGDNVLLIKEVKTKIVKSIKQVYERILEIDTYTELEYFRGKKIVPIIVFMDIPLSSAHLYREFIDEELDDLEQNGFAGIKDFKIHLMNIDELEIYNEAVDLIPIEKIFEAYEKNLAEGFTSILHKTIGRLPKNKFLDDIYKKYVDSMTAVNN